MPEIYDSTTNLTSRMEQGSIGAGAFDTISSNESVLHDKTIVVVIEIYRST